MGDITYFLKHNTSELYIAFQESYLQIRQTFILNKMNYTNQDNWLYICIYICIYINIRSPMYSIHYED